LEAGFGDGVEVDELHERVHVRLLEVGARNFSLFGLRRGTSVKFVLNPLDDRRLGGAAVVGLELHAVPVPRIVAGGNDYAAGSTEIFYGMRDSGSGHVIVREHDVDAEGGDGLGGEF